MKVTARALLVQVALVGLVIGVLGVLGWRYATRRLVVIDNPPTVKPGDKGFMFTFDSLEYVAGPPWWPGLLLLPAVGVLVGTAVGLICWYALRSNHRPWATWLVLATPAVATGASVAIATLLLTHEDRPAVLVRAVTGAPSSNATVFTDSQWDREWTPIGLWFPVIGILGALLITFALHSDHRRWRRHLSRLMGLKLPV